MDVLLGIRGLDPKPFSRTVEVPLEGTRLRFGGREDFIAMKVAAGGPIDLVDAENAIAADPKSLDLELVRNLGLRFGATASASLERMLGDLGLGRQVSHSQGTVWSPGSAPKEDEPGTPRGPEPLSVSGSRSSHLRVRTRASILEAGAVNLSLRQSLVVRVQR